jgi:hypothetical protein
MSKFEYAWWCFVCAAVLGGSWGGFLYWFYPSVGIAVGSSLFFFCFVILINIDKNAQVVDEDEELQDFKRRFNDV